MELIQRYFPHLSPRQLNQFAALGDLYRYWNAQINLISRRDMEHFYERHVLHALGIAAFCNFEPQARILDLGTGGGFPGIPLAVLFPEAQFHLVDSIAKKIKVVEAVAAELELKNLQAETVRGEKLYGSYDFIVSRAVTQMPRFLGWTRGKLRTGKRAGSLPNGILYLKGGDLQEELKALPQAQVFALSEVFAEAFFETKKLVYLPTKGKK